MIRPERLGRVPVFAPTCVSRPGLIRRLSAHGDAWLALVTAPAGFGKTTLLSEWAAADDRPFAWATLDERDDDATQLAGTIADALHRSGVEQPALSAALAALGPQRGSFRRPRAVWDPGDVSSGFVLVLDDAHVVSAAVLREIITVLHTQLPDGAQVVLASRNSPALGTGSLRASRALIEVGAHDLAMTTPEATALLREAGLELEPSVVERLVSRTEGWPAGLYLAALSLRDADDPPAAAARFSGDDHLVSEYVRDEVVAQLTVEETSFVTCASVLDELCGPVCDAVLAREGSAALLAQLVGRNLLVALDASHDRCRWPVLLREMFQAELRRTRPELVASLHRRASDWHAERGDVGRAVEHAVRAGDAARTGDLLWASMFDFVAAGRNETVQGWLGAFSAEQIGRSAPLSLTAAHSHLARGDLALAHHWGLIAAGACRQQEAPAAPSLDAGLAVIGAAAARAGAHRMAQDVMRAYELEPDESPWRGVCCFLAGAADYLTGDRVRARERLQEGVQRSEIAAPSVAALCLAQLAMIAIEEEDWDTAAEASGHAQQAVQAYGLDECATSALVFAASAATHVHHGRVDEAKRDLRRAGELMVRLGDFLPWYGAQTRILLARAALGLADIVRARTLLAEASRLARRTPDAVIFQSWLNDAWGRIDEHAENALVGPLGPSSLTTAELRILRFLPTHLSFREIAKRLQVSANTVKTQAHAVYRKLDASSRSEAVAHATQAGLLGQ